MLYFSIQFRYITGFEIVFFIQKYQSIEKKNMSFVILDVNIALIRINCFFNWRSNNLQRRMSHFDMHKM